MEFITEPQRQIPVITQADLCVIGGGCTGVFAAVRAARLGLKVALVEQQGMLGGAAVGGLVNIWHSTNDTSEREQIIAGLTTETLERLQKNDALQIFASTSSRYNFSPWELTCILDEYIKENKIELMLHTTYVSAVCDGSRVQAILVENTDGRGAIRADFFIDATGNGRVAGDLAIASYVHPCVQPPTACFHLMGDLSRVDLGKLLREHGAEFGLEDDWGWDTIVAGCPGIAMRADYHVYNVRCDIAKDLTYAELEGHRQAHAFTALLKKYGDPKTKYAITALSSYIGIRETVHYRTRYQADRIAMLTGKRYEDPVLNGTYPVDIHHSDDMGITFMYLDGREERIYGKYTRCENDNWREREGYTGEPATYYQLPFELLVGEQHENFIAAGRMVNADIGAFGALRVMVNLNQLGEAAGVAAYLCLHEEKTLQSIEGAAVTKLLRKGGSAL